MPTTDASAATRRNQLLLLGVVGAIQVADPLVATLTLVKMSDALNLTASLQALAAGVSSLALAATVIASGTLADRLGRRSVLAGSMLVSAAGEILSAFAPGAGLFLLGRVITGVALGATFAAAYGMVKNVSDEADRGPALALFGIVATIFPLLVAVATGPVAAFDWRLAYLILPVVSVLVFPFTLRMLPEVPRVPGGRVDYLGMVLIGVGIVGLLRAISAITTGLTSPSFLVPVLAGVAALVGYVVRASRMDAPVLPPRMFTHPGFLAAVLTGIVFNFVSGASGQLSANFWQYLMHLPTAVIGAASLPLAVFAVASSVITGRLIKAGVATWKIIATGMVMAVIGVVSMVFITADAPYLAFIPMMALCGLAGAALSIVQSGQYLSLAPAKWFGPVTSSKTAVGQFGYAVGLTGGTVLVSIVTLNGVETASGGRLSGEGNWDAITSFLATGQTDNPILNELGTHVVAQSYATGFAWASGISAALVAVLGLITVVCLRRPQASMDMETFLTNESDTTAKEQVR